MAELARSSIAVVQLQKLDFLLGDGRGVETLYPPEGDAVYFPAAVSGSRESCERFLRVDYFADIPGYGIETFRAMFTYSESRKRFRCWAFSTVHEEPAHLEGDFVDNSLVLVSDPIPMPWGLQRLRMTFTPLPAGGYFYLSERWEPEGWKKYCTVSFLHEE